MIRGILPAAAVALLSMSMAQSTTSFSSKEGDLVFLGHGNRTKYHYDDWGNLRQREHVGRPGTDVVSKFTTASDLTHPHAVKELIEGGTSQQFSYKPGGQAEVVRGIQVQWAPFGLPVHVSDGWGDAKYEYDAFNSRFHTSETSTSGVRDIVSINGLFEQELSMGTGNVVYKYSVRGPEGLVSQVRRDFAAGMSSEVSYIHADHLGSPDTVTDASGAVIERIKHDPFGQRRHPWALEAPIAETLVLDPALGFTGHVSADRFGLTDMRGRIYDARAAGFLSPDPVQHPVAQGLSRMAYVRNSPIMATDPSGFDPVRLAAFEPEVVYGRRLPTDPASLTGQGGRLPVTTATNDQQSVGDERLASDHVLETVGAGFGALGKGIAFGLGITFVLGALPFTATAGLIVLGSALLAYQLANGGADKFQAAAVRAGTRIASGKVTIGDVKDGAFFVGGLLGGGAAANHLANTALTGGGLTLARAEAGLPVGGPSVWVPPGGPSGPWAPAAAVRGGAVAQTLPGSCGSACAEMLSGGTRNQASVVAQIGEWAGAGDVGASLGLTGGYFNSAADALAVANRGPMGAVLWEPGARAGHMVVTEPISGGFLVRDPLPGVTYSVGPSWIEQWVVGGVFK